MPKVTYNNKNAIFFPALKKAVDAYFKEKNIKKTGNFSLHLKTVTLVPIAITLYILLLTLNMPTLLGVLLSLVLGFIMAGIGFNIMHDACHGSYSTKKWVNELLGFSLNALGGNSFMWKQKHNIIHHTYTNVDGVDDDIAKSPFIRMCGTQKWVPMHRIQHIYSSFLYAISSLFWVLFQDFAKYFTKKVYTTPLAKMDRRDHIIFWASKILYLFFYVALPIILVGWQAWLIGFLCMHFSLGFTLSIVFQLAHVVEETEFEFAPQDSPKTIENEWAIHQLKTTANFASGNKLISWYVGGLNYQIEHHLFPRISHVHYPAISRIVKEKCEEHNIPYTSIPSMRQAIVSHFRFMKSLGEKPQLNAFVASN